MQSATKNRCLIETGTGPVRPPETDCEREAVRKQLIAQQEFVRAKAFANLSDKGLMLAFDAAADMRADSRGEVLAMVMGAKLVRRRERVAIGKMVHRIHRRISNAGLRINWGAAVRYPSKREV